MLNKNNERELAYLVFIDAIEPIEGSDNCECAVVGGWHIMTKKGTFLPGDIGIYFEIDSLLPSDRECFNFLQSKKYRIKTQKYTFGGKGRFISQGLLMHPNDVGWKVIQSGDVFVEDENCECHTPIDESRFVTKLLGVTYYEPEDNVRKANADPMAKYKAMAGRHPKVFRNPIIQKIYKYDWGKKLLFVFFGKKKDSRGFPEWVKKTDEERIQNMPWILQNKEPWIVTEKIDGTSTTFTMKREKGTFKENRVFIVCSRNVAFEDDGKDCFYDSNVYWEMANKYHIKDVMNDILDKYPDIEFITIQGETYGAGIQKRDYGMKEHDLAVFNVIDNVRGRYNSCLARTFLAPYNIPFVPILHSKYILPDTVDELLEFATGESTIDGGMREGLVFRDLEGEKSFKAVSNEFLLKYHNF